MTAKSLMILIVGPYRAGAGEALALLRAGHLPVLAEWLALPLAELAGDASLDELPLLVSERLLARCDAVLCAGGLPQAVDQLLAQARTLGLPVFSRLQEVPGCADLPDPAEDVAGADALVFPEEIESQLGDLAARYGRPARVLAELPDGLFDPLTQTDRMGEVCMVLRRSSGRLLTFRKDIYPPGVMRLLTGGVRPGELIEDGLLREVAEETSLDVVVRRFLAAIAYRAPQTPPGGFAFFTFAFLLDELGGELVVQDPEERVEAFGEATVADLYELAAFLEQLDERQDRAISGSWRSWGVFRGVAHRVIADQLMGHG